MEKLIKCKIDDELENGIKKLDPKDAYRFALICSEHALNFFEFKDNTNINYALQTINNNLDNVTEDLAKQIALTINKEAEKVEKINLSLFYMLKAFSHTVATLHNIDNAIYSAIYSATAIYSKTKDKEVYKKEKLYQLEKLNKFLIMYEN